MYETPKKMSMAKLIEICVLIFLIIWGIVLLVNYKRYSDAKKPILMIHAHNEYEDGYTDNYIGLFYNIRYYRRVSVTRDEMVPFWKIMENPTPQPDLPIPEKGYNVPENNYRQDKFRGLLYFYNREHDLIGTYKCLNGNSTCDKVKTGWDKYNVLNTNPFTVYREHYYMDVMYEKYAWVDDSFQQTAKYGEPTYERIIYLYKIDDKDPKILAKYSDIKESTYDEYRTVADGYKNQYIVKHFDTGKWGVIKFKENEEIEEVVPFEYDSITYDLDTHLYILCKDDAWMIKDFDKDSIIAQDIKEPIYDVWRNGNLTYYYITGVSRNISGLEQLVFKAYREDGTGFITQEGITGIFPFKKCVMYVDSSDNMLKFMDYGKEVRHSIQLNFSIMVHDDVVHPAVAISEYDDTFARLQIYKSHDKSNEFEIQRVNINDLSRN